MDRCNNKVWSALLIGICSGVASVAVDLDHYISYQFKMETRLLHIPLAIIAFLFSIYCISRLTRLYHKPILTRVASP